MPEPQETRSYPAQHRSSLHTGNRQNLREEKPLLKGKRDPGMRKSRKKRAGLRWGLRRKGQSQEWVQEGGSIQEEGLGKWVLIKKSL